MSVQGKGGPYPLMDVLDRILDKGLVIDVGQRVRLGERELAASGENAVVVRSEIHPNDTDPTW